MGVLNSGLFDTRERSNDQCFVTKVQDEYNEEKEEDVVLLDSDAQSVWMLEFLWMTQKTLVGEEHKEKLSVGFDWETGQRKLDGCPIGYRWVDHDSSERKGMLTTLSANVEVANEEEAAYGTRVGFPTTRRPVDYLRSMYQGGCHGASMATITIT